MAGAATSLGRASTRTCFLDGPPTELRSHQEGIPRAFPGGTDGAGQVLQWLEIAPEDSEGLEAELSKDMYRLWGLLPQQDKREFAAIFSSMAKRFVKALAKAGPGQ